MPRCWKSAWRYAQFEDIRAYAGENDPETGRPWMVSDSQLRKYIVASNKLLARDLEKDRGDVLNLQLATRRRLFAQALLTGDLRTALAVLKDEAELHGLYSKLHFLKRANIRPHDGSRAGRTVGFLASGVGPRSAA